MEPVHTAQILPPRFRSIFLIILPQKDVFLNVIIDLQENESSHFYYNIFGTGNASQPYYIPACT